MKAKVIYGEHKGKTGTVLCPFAPWLINISIIA